MTTAFDSRKRAVSIRMNSSDVTKVKRLAERLGARDSDVIRFAVKLMLSRLAPLYDNTSHGTNLLPVFVECGPEFVRFFDLDAAKLESIINRNAPSELTVEPEDLALLAMTGSTEPYAALRLGELRSDTYSAQATTDRRDPLRNYFYDKYVFRAVASHTEDDDVAGFAGVTPASGEA